MMFESILTNFKSKSSKVSDSVGSLKGTTSKISESFSQIRCNLMHKTSSLSSYFSNRNHLQNGDSKNYSHSTPNLTPNKVKKTVPLVGSGNRPIYQNNFQEFIHFNPISDSEELDNNIVDRFVRVINVEEDHTNLCRKYSFRVSLFDYVKTWRQKRLYSKIKGFSNRP